MQIDSRHSDRYLLCREDGTIGRGWAQGIELTQRDGSPPGHLDHDFGRLTPQLNAAEPFDLSGHWPDTEHYDQNSPGILDQARDRDQRAYRGNLQKAFWLNVLRV